MSDTRVKAFMSTGHAREMKHYARSIWAEQEARMIQVVVEHGTTDVYYGPRALSLCAQPLMGFEDSHITRREQRKAAAIKGALADSLRAIMPELDRLATLAAMEGRG